MDRKWNKNGPKLIKKHQKMDQNWVKIRFKITKMEQKGPKLG